MLDPSIRKIYFEAYDRYPTQWTTVFNVQNSDSATIKESSITGLGMAKDMEEGQEIPEGTAYQGYNVSYAVNKVGEAIKITKEMLEDRITLFSLNSVNSVKPLTVKLRAILSQTK